MRVSIDADRTVFTLRTEPRCRDPRYQIDSTNPRFDHLTDLVLAAVSSGATVTVHNAICNEADPGSALVGFMSIDR
jgi:hypothetical protein